MSQLLISISEIPGLSSGARRALVGLISFRNKRTGQCNPGIEALCTRIQAPRRTVIRWLDELYAKEIFTRKRPFGASNRYDFPALSPLFGSSAKNGTHSCAKSGTPVVPNVALPHLSYEQTKKNRIAAASPEVETGPAAAAENKGETQTPKPPARETSESGFRVVKQTLNELAPLVRLPLPDDDLVWRVIDASNGASGEEIQEALVFMWKRDALRNMRSWGFIPLKIADLARRAATA